ncbi:unnamed protein product, partial [Effrenium voratum]
RGSGGSSLEDFVREYGISETVASELRTLSPEEQAQVMSCNITNARNPSAMVKSRIHAVRDEFQRHQMGRQVEEYLARHGVDEVASATLRGAPPEVQARIIEQ